MRRLLLLATVSAAAFALPSGASASCGTWISVGDGNTGTVYLVDDGGGVDWIYAETNGTHNLQRGDGGAFDSTQIYSAPDPCGVDGTPDSKFY